MFEIIIKSGEAKIYNVESNEGFKIVSRQPIITTMETIKKILEAFIFYKEAKNEYFERKVVFDHQAGNKTLEQQSQMAEAEPYHQAEKKLVTIQKDFMEIRADLGIEKISYLTHQSVNFIFKRQEAKGLLYQIEDAQGNSKGFLLGSYHFYDEPLIKFSKTIKETFNKSEVIAFEGLTEFKPKELLKEEFEAYPHIAKIIQSFNELVYDKLKIMEGVDYQLKIRAKQKNKKLVRLESKDQYWTAIKLIYKEYKCCDYTQEQLQAGYEQIKNLITKWREGNLDYFLEFVSQHKIIQGKETTNIHIKRNIPMVDALEHNYLKKDICAFSVVGLSHLFGEEPGQEGMIQLLKNRGWTIKKLD